MNFPTSVPTDNLYKFMAITGLIIIIVCFYWRDKQTDEVMMEAIELRSHIQFVAGKDKILNEKKKLIEDIKNSTLEDALKILNDRAEILKEEPVLTKRWERLFYLTNEMIRLQRIINIALVLGVIITCAGFFLWYTRLQKYQDILMKREAENLLSTLNGDSLYEIEKIASKNADLNVKSKSNKANSADAKNRAAD